MELRTSDPELAVYRLKWQKIFDALVQLLNSRDSQLQTLLKERNLIVNRFKTQLRVHESNVAFLEDRISQMNDELIVQDKLRLLDSAKLDLAVASRKREALLYKLKLDQAEGDLAVFGEYFNILSGKSSGPQPIGNDAESQPDSNTLEDEVRRLKLDYNKLLLEKKAEVSALSDEKKFVWHQYNLMESDLSCKLKTKEDELRIANEKIVQLLAAMEKIQASNAEKDEEVAKLKSGIEEKDTILRKSDEEITRLAHELELLRNTRSASETPVLCRCTYKSRTRRSLAEKETISRKKGEEITRLAHEMELLRNTRSASETPVLGRCTSKSRTRRSLASTDNHKAKIQVTVRKENSVTKVPSAASSGKERKMSSKRKAAETEPSEDVTPKLFSSRFKIPRLKKTS